MGSRILNHFLLLIAGLVLGALGSIAAQTTLALGSIQFPVGVILALLAVACLLVGLRVLGESRWPAFTVALGIVIPIALFAVPSAGGSVIIPANGVGYAWVYSPVVLAIIIVGWPALRRHHERPDAKEPDGGENVARENGTGRIS